MWSVNDASSSASVRSLRHTIICAVLPLHQALASTIKARWICEQAHQQLKEEHRLDHFEGRSWQGLHRHALMTNDRLHLPPASPPRNREAGEKRVTGPPPQPSLSAVRHTIIAHMVFAWRRRCPHCRKWLSSA
jgi:hypothetical protein